jgi:hypothetical protein
LEFGWNAPLPPRSRDLGGDDDDTNSIYVSESINGGHFTTKRAKARLEGACAWFSMTKETHEGGVFNWKKGSPTGKSRAFFSAKNRGMESNKNMGNGVEAVGVWGC